MQNEKDNRSNTPGHGATASGVILDGDSTRALTPSRYRAIPDDDGTYIICEGMPTIRLYVSREISVTKATRKRYPRQSIFLDGAYSEAPFLDHDTRQYSLDHHAGCTRAFTLATCEQAVVMLLQGIPLAEDEWRIFINEPDLDAVLAAWILLNAPDLLANDRKLLYDAMPLIRVESVIDAHGFDMAVLTAMPAEVYEREKKRIDALRSPELAHRADGTWATLDVLRYAFDLLSRLDQALFSTANRDQLVRITQLTRLPLHEQKVVVLCESTRGIYEVESQLKERFGKQLGLIVLDAGNRRFTIRQSDPFLPRDLTVVYEQLNRLDENVVISGNDGNRWGGANDIGGSPRSTGSALTGSQILEAIIHAYQQHPLGWFGRFWGRFISSRPQ